MYVVEGSGVTVEEYEFPAGGTEGADVVEKYQYAASAKATTISKTNSIIPGRSQKIKRRVKCVIESFYKSKLSLSISAFATSNVLHGTCPVLSKFLYRMEHVPFQGGDRRAASRPTRGVMTARVGPCESEIIFTRQETTWTSRGSRSVTRNEMARKSRTCTLEGLGP